MEKIKLICKILFIVVLITSVVLFILGGYYLAAWVVNAVLWSFILREMFNVICDKLDLITLGVDTIILGQITTAKKADDEPKAEPEQK